MWCGFCLASFPVKRGGSATALTAMKMESGDNRSYMVGRREFSRNLFLTVTPLISLPTIALSDTENKTGRGLGERAKEVFAEGMETGMVEYEDRISSLKRNLFAKIKESDIVADLGIGTGPNIKYMPEGIRLYGIDPNRYMWAYASEKARKRNIDLTLLDGIGEKIPLENSSCDVVITTLTLCSVRDPTQTIQEVLRVLKPGGRHLFIEHVLAPRSRPVLRGMQTLFSPLQTIVADGCHLDRNTAAVLRAAPAPGYSEIVTTEFDASFGGGIEDWLNPIRPHIFGYAQKAGF